MPLILAGRLAANIQRIGAVADEQLTARACQRILEAAHLHLPVLREVMNSLDHGRASQTLRSRGLTQRPRHDRVPNRDVASSRSHTGENRSSEDAIDPRASLLETIVARRRSVRPLPGLRPRYLDIPLPAESLLHVSADLGLGADVYVASPALIWLLASSDRGFASTVTLALEFCGSYALQDGPDAPCSFNLQPATTPLGLARGIRSLADGAGERRVVGLARCLAACPFVLANSASPMESVVAALLSLPVSRGGYGIANLVLNDRIELAEEQRVIANRPYLSVDGRVAGLPLGYEYDSGEFHSGRQRESRDRARLIAAQSLGYRLLPLTWDVVNDERRFDAFGEEFARLAGKVVRGTSERTRSRRRRLRQELGLFNDATAAGGFEDDLVPLEAYDL